MPIIKPSLQPLQPVVAPSVASSPPLAGPTQWPVRVALAGCRRKLLSCVRYVLACGLTATREIAAPPDALRATPQTKLAHASSSPPRSVGRPRSPGLDQARPYAIARDDARRQRLRSQSVFCASCEVRRRRFMILSSLTLARQVSPVRLSTRSASDQQDPPVSEPAATSAPVTEGDG